MENVEMENVVDQVVSDTVNDLADEVVAESGLDVEDSSSSDGGEESEVQLFTKAEEIELVKKMVSMFTSRSRGVEDDGTILEFDTYSQDQKDEIAQSIVSLLVKDMDSDKAAIADTILSYESLVQQKVERTDANGDVKEVIYESVVSSFSGSSRFDLTKALVEFRVNQSLIILN